MFWSGRARGAAGDSAGRGGGVPAGELRAGARRAGLARDRPDGVCDCYIERPLAPTVYGVCDCGLSVRVLSEPEPAMALSLSFRTSKPCWMSLL